MNNRKIIKTMALALLFSPAMSFPINQSNIVYANYEHNNIGKYREVIVNIGYPSAVDSNATVKVHDISSIIDSSRTTSEKSINDYKSELQRNFKGGNLNISNYPVIKTGTANTVTSVSVPVSSDSYAFVIEVDGAEVDALIFPHDFVYERDGSFSVNLKPAKKQGERIPKGDGGYNPYKDTTPQDEYKKFSDTSFLKNDGAKVVILAGIGFLIAPFILKEKNYDKEIA